MLQKIRDGSSGPLAYIVVGVIAFVFGVWGIGSYFTPAADPVVITAAGTDITQSQVRDAFNQRYQQLRQQGDNANNISRDQVRKNVINQLIDQAVMTHYAQSAGFRVTDADLLAQIRSNPQFQENGEFSAARYKSLLSRVGMSPSGYESRLRRSLLDSEVRRLVAGSAFTVSLEVSALYRQAHEQRELAILNFAPSAYAGDVKVDDHEIAQYYDEHGKQFMRAPRVRLAYVLLSADDLSPKAPAEDQLKKLYQQHKGELGTPEKRSADELRIAIGDKGTDAARHLVQEVLAKAKKGDSLEQIAADTDGVQFRQIDEQPESALPNAVGKALFGLSEGALSSPVKGDKAWYLLRLTGTQAAATPAFDDPAVQKQLKAMARQQEVAGLFRSKSQKLEDLAYQAPNGLGTISDKLGLEIQHSGWVSKGGADSGIGENKAVRKAAFSDAVLKDKLNSDVIDLGNQRRVVVRVTDHQGAKRKPLDEVHDAIRKRLVADKARQHAYKIAQKALADAKAGDSFKDLAAAEQGARLTQPGFVSRGDAKLDPQVLQAAFDMPEVSDKHQPRYRIVTTDKGDVALVKVSASRVEKSDSKQTDASRKMIAQELRVYNAQFEYAVLDHYLRKQAKVKIHKDLID